MSEKVNKPKKEVKITVCGVSFSAKDVKTAVVILDGREIHIGEPSEKPKVIGFAK